ncbi:PREDICTED: uncharacterized protein LOC109584838 [Amphimedon queenslandica]|uniref:Uncharacterized protein n=1 Tax=Amphimedon queenslandica TaxID=400682 RepID=A0AAN0JHP7_AMPQE|nr:PREDICTED: uncharacterized protein LOC109584838 [Amphimedon queenslandica]|eukprot:XP_019856292.1 PREDICTED: uncharacterized protein LOC109584838 [Amphimedon queenslandica]
MASLAMLFLFSLYSISTCTATDSCQEMAASGNCAFYSECVEKRVPCGPNGYALGYGGKYCIKFGENIDCFPANGQQWINKVRICLETALVNSTVYRNNATCEDIKDYAFKTHPQCYLDAGFCSVILDSPTNLYCLYKVFDVKDFFSKLAINQVYQTLKSCASG